MPSSAAEYLAEAGEVYLHTVKQPWFAAPLYVATAELALLESRLVDAEAAVAEGLQVASGNLAFAAPLYVLGMRAAADRAELARAHRNADEVLQVCRLGDTLGVELRAQMSPERADGAVPTPPTKAYATVGEAELARLKRPQRSRPVDGGRPGMGAADRAIPRRLRPLARGRGAAASWCRPGDGRRRRCVRRTRRQLLWAPNRSASRSRA